MRVEPSRRYHLEGAGTQHSVKPSRGTVQETAAKQHVTMSYHVIVKFRS